MNILKLTAAAAALVLTAAAATAQSATAGAGANAAAGAQNGDMTSNSVGLAGLPGGVCSEGFTLGAQGFGIGVSSINKACLVLQTARGTSLTPAEKRAFELAAYANINYRMVAPSASTTASTKAPTAAPAQVVASYTKCALDDGKIRVAVRSGADQATAIAQCKAKLGY